MSVRVQWDTSHKDIIHYFFDSAWSWAEFYDAFHYAHGEINAASRPIAVILSGPDSMALPPNMLTNAVKVIKQKRSKNTAALIFVTRNLFVRTMLRAVRQLSSTDLRTADTLDDARTIAVQVLDGSSESIQQT